MKKNISRQNLILIGGGVMRNDETVEIDKWIVGRINKKRPICVFIPAASMDLKEYIDDFSTRYSIYGCDVYTIKLFKEKFDKNKDGKLLGSADLIYIGGGDPELLMKIWWENNINDYINPKTLIAGMSAGAAIWGTSFLNFQWDKKINLFTNYSLEKGFGIINLLIWTHFTLEAFKDKTIMKLITSKTKILALEDNTAAYWNQEDELKFFTKNKGGIREIIEI